MIDNPEKLLKLQDIEFISYTGKYPNLCSGILTLKVKNKEYKFGYEYKNENLLERFYHPACGEYDCEETGEWLIKIEELPKELQEYAHEIDYLINKNIEYGHCKGCL